MVYKEFLYHVERQILDKKNREKQSKDRDRSLDTELQTANPFGKPRVAMSAASYRHKSYLEPHARDSPQKIAQLSSVLDNQIQERHVAIEEERNHSKVLKLPFYYIET
jgi:hypothetical protein